MKRKFVSPPKNPNSNNSSPGKKQPRKKRRTISTIKKDHEKIVHSNNATFEPKSSRISLEQAADGMVPTATPNNLPLEDSKDNIEEEEEDDDIQVSQDKSIATYMSTRIGHSYNSGDKNHQNADNQNLSEDDV